GDAVVECGSPPEPERRTTGGARGRRAQPRDEKRGVLGRAGATVTEAGAKKTGGGGSRGGVGCADPEGEGGGDRAEPSRWAQARTHAAGLVSDSAEARQETWDRERADFAGSFKPAGGACERRGT